MQHVIKPIETVYKGYRFRSRLEARWAVFFDALGLEWEYEPEGYDLGDDIKYLPDFWIPTWSRWLEIKGSEPNEMEIDKAMRLCFATKMEVYICRDTPMPGDQYVRAAYKWQRHTDGYPGGDTPDSCISEDGYVLGYPKPANHYTYFAQCPRCGKVDIAYNGSWGFLFCGCEVKTDMVWMDCQRTPLLLSAYTAARQARFEHGEHP